MKKKSRVQELYDDNYYFLLSASFFVIIGVVVFLWALYDQSIANRFDINNIDELSEVNYQAYYHEEEENPYVLVEGEDIEDIHLVKMQNSLYKNSQLSVPIYWVEDGEGFDIDYDFYTKGLLKVATLNTTDALHEVKSFEKIYLSESDPNSIGEWDISDGELVDGVYYVYGELFGDSGSLDKYSQIKALSEMVELLNEENESFSGDAVVMEFKSGEDKVFYHTAYDGILAQSSLYKSVKK